VRSNVCSPNWYWSRLSCSIDRSGWHRTVTDKTGAIVCVNAGYSTELGIARFMYFGAIAVLTLRKTNAIRRPLFSDNGQTNHTNQQQSRGKYYGGNIGNNDLFWWRNDVN